MNAINSNLSFGRAQAAKKANTAETPKQPRPKFSELGNRTMSEKYGNVNITTESAPIILTDWIVDHAIELGTTAVALVGAFAKGKQIMSGTTSALQKAVSNGEGVGAVATAAKKFGSNVKTVLNKTSITDLKGKGLSESVQTIESLSHKAVDPDSKVMRNVSDFLAGKAESKPNSFIGKLVNKLTEGISIEKAAEAAEEAAEALPTDKVSEAVTEAVSEAGEKVQSSTSELIQKALAEKYGLSNGGDFIDDAIAAAGAGGVAFVTNEVTDKVTDMNDASVEGRAEEANKRYYAQQAERLADSLLGVL